MRLRARLIRERDGSRLCFSGFQWIEHNDKVRFTSLFLLLIPGAIGIAVVLYRSLEVPSEYMSVRPEDATSPLAGILVAGIIAVVAGVWLLKRHGMQHRAVIFHNSGFFTPFGVPQQPSMREVDAQFLNAIRIRTARAGRREYVELIGANGRTLQLTERCLPHEAQTIATQLNLALLELRAARRSHRGPYGPAEEIADRARRKDPSARWQDGQDPAGRITQIGYHWYEPGPIPPTIQVLQLIVAIGLVALVPVLMTGTDDTRLFALALYGLCILSIFSLRHMHMSQSTIRLVEIDLSGTLNTPDGLPRASDTKALASTLSDVTAVDCVPWGDLECVRMHFRSGDAMNIAVGLTPENAREVATHIALSLQDMRAEARRVKVEKSNNV